MSWADDMRDQVRRIRDAGVAAGERVGTNEQVTALAVIAGASLLLVEALVEIHGELEELNNRESQRP